MEQHPHVYNILKQKYIATRFNLVMNRAEKNMASLQIFQSFPYNLEYF